MKTKFFPFLKSWPAAISCKKDDIVAKKTGNEEERKRKKRERERKVEINSQITKKSKSVWLVRMREKAVLLRDSFSSPEPVVSSSRGRETRGSGNSRYFLTSGRACAEVTNITAHAHNGFLSLTAPLGEKFYFLSSLQRVASWDVLKMHHFTQLGFTDNLELKEEDSNINRLNTLLVCRTETINRQTIV